MHFAARLFRYYVQSSSAYQVCCKMCASCVQCSSLSPALYESSDTIEPRLEGAGRILGHTTSRTPV
jgi:hypothetical protein